MVHAAAWTDARLQNLFDRYRRAYWPRSRRLRRYTIRRDDSIDSLGRWERDDRALLINVERHPSDRELRATVLHEMVHAVVGKPGHHAPFWAQLEYLLTRGAPITIGFPELGERGSAFAIIPRRFWRCRRMFRPVYERYRRDFDRRTAHLHSEEWTADTFESQCEDAAISGATWRAVWGHYARAFGFVDLDGRVLPWARKYWEAGRRGYRRGRRFHLENERTRAFFESLAARQAAAPSGDGS